MHPVHKGIPLAKKGKHLRMESASLTVIWHGPPALETPGASPRFSSLACLPVNCKYQRRNKHSESNDAKRHSDPQIVALTSAHGSVLAQTVRLLTGVVATEITAPLLYRSGPVRPKSALHQPNRNTALVDRGAYELHDLREAV